ncbi:MAG: hypothetical protein O7G85_08500, partial [Planctomycetota bacterium]|nr:hypothetical protein [Planctomycetota bacterium]
MSNRVERPSGSPRPQAFAASIDPILVIRRHILVLILSVIMGGVLGTGAYFGLRIVYPLYSGEVLFELQPGLQDPTSVGVVDISRDDLIERLARTQAVLMTSREVLERAMENPTIKRNTEWHKKFVGKDDVFDIQEAVDELEEDLSAPVIRGTNLFALRWSTHRKNDVTVVLDAITQSYENKRKALD